MQLSVVTPLWQDRPAAENLEVAMNADRLGFKELWIGEMATYDAFAFATAAGLATDNIGFSIGPLAVSVRTPMTMAMGTASVKRSSRDLKLTSFIGVSEQLVEIPQGPMIHWPKRSGKAPVPPRIGDTGRVRQRGRPVLAGQASTRKVIERASAR